MIKTTDIKGNFAGYSESFFSGENQIHIYKDFIWEFDMTESDPDAPKPSTMGFKYRIKKEQK